MQVEHKVFEIGGGLQFHLRPKEHTAAGLRTGYFTHRGHLVSGGVWAFEDGQISIYLGDRSIKHPPQ